MDGVPPASGRPPRHTLEMASIQHFAQEYDQLQPGEQAMFADSVRHLLSDGIIWRDHDPDRRIYGFLLRRGHLVGDYLHLTGWEMQHDERLAIFSVAHRDGAHRLRLDRDTTIWLLLLRLIYAEKRERIELRLTRHPTITVAEVAQRYADFFPGKAVRKKTSLDAALRQLQGCKLIRAGGGGHLRAGDGDQIIELLPTLEVAVPANEIAELAERIRSYDLSQKKADKAASED